MQQTIDIDILRQYLGELTAQSVLLHSQLKAERAQAAQDKAALQGELDKLKAAAKVPADASGD